MVDDGDALQMPLKRMWELWQNLHPQIVSRDV
jgi:hypothetical protein